MSTSLVILLVGAAILLLAVGGLRLVAPIAEFLIEILSSRLFILIAVAGLVAAAFMYESPRAVLSSIAGSTFAKIGGLFGPSSVHCSQHAEVFSQIGKGDVATCWQDLKTGETMKVDLFGGKGWRMSPSSESGVTVELLRGSGISVYRGPYRQAMLPHATTVVVTNDGKPQRFYIRIEG